MSSHRRVAAVLTGLTLAAMAPVAAQQVATVYLKEGGTIRGQVMDESDPNAIRIRSEKSGTTFMLKRAWVDSVVRPNAQPAPTPVPTAAPAKAAATRASEPMPLPVTPKAVESKPVEPRVVEPKPIPVMQAAPTPAPQVEPVAVRPTEPTPVPVAQATAVRVDGLEPPTASPASAPAKASKAAKEEKSAPVRSPSKWYIGGGGAAYTGLAGDGTDIGYTGMVGYGTGVGSAFAVRLGGSGSYWRLGNNTGDFYDLAGNIDLVVGPRGPRFVAPYAVLGGMGGVRSTSPVQVGATGYTRDPLYGARVGAGLSARRIFLEASYQHVWVDGVASGYVPFVFGFRF